MQNFTSYRVARMTACRKDLLDNGMDLGALGRAALSRFIREHLEYFQAMLGDESSADEVEALMHHERMVNEGARWSALRAPVGGPSDAEDDLEGRLARAMRRRDAMSHMTLEELMAAATELRRQSVEVIEQMEAVQERLETLHL